MVVQPGLHVCLSCRHGWASVHLNVVVEGGVKDYDGVLWNIWNGFHIQPSLEVLVIHFRMVVYIRASCLKYKTMFIASM